MDRRFLASYEARRARSAGLSSRLEAEQKFVKFQGEVITVDLSAVEVCGSREEFVGKEWLEGKLKSRRPLGFDVEWSVQRGEDSIDRPIDLLQFSDGDTVMLIRTHETRRWLPEVVKAVLVSPTVRKVCVDVTRTTLEKKLEGSFDVKLFNLTDLHETATRKGKTCSGLKLLAEEFHLNIKKESRAQRSDWGAPSLSEEQIAYAADDAYFTLVVHEELEELEDVTEEVEEYDEPMSVLSLMPGWAEQGVVKKHDGMYCELCGKGPMTDKRVMEKHLEGKEHFRKSQGDGANVPMARIVAKQSTVPALFGEELPEELIPRGITLSDGISTEIAKGMCYCSCCNAGPFMTVESIHQHLKGSRHQKKEQQLAKEAARSPQLSEELVAAGIEFCADTKLYRCTWCDVCVSDLQSVAVHVGGTKHKKSVSGADKDAPLEPTEELMAAGIELCAVTKKYRCRFCDLPCSDLSSAALHVAGKRHRKVAGEDASIPAEGLDHTPVDPDRFDIDRFPEYVKIDAKGLRCSLCEVHGPTDRAMLDHLASDRHSRRAKIFGFPELVYLTETDELQEFETGKKVVRGQEFDEASCRGSNVARRDLHRDRSRERAVSSSRNWATWQTESRTRSSEVGQPVAAVEELELESGTCCAYARRQVNVPSGWEPDNFLVLVEGQRVDIIQSDDDGWSWCTSETAAGYVRTEDLLVMRSHGDPHPAAVASRAASSTRTDAHAPVSTQCSDEHGWQLVEERCISAPRQVDSSWAVVHRDDLDLDPCSRKSSSPWEPGGTSGYEANVQIARPSLAPQPAPSPCRLQAGDKVIAVMDITSPPPGWAPEDFAKLKVGQRVEVLVVDDDDQWFWGWSSSGEGWVPAHAVKAAGSR